MLTETPLLGCTQQLAIAICTAIEAVCPEFGCHVALTGGCLYKSGPDDLPVRKDLDLLFYRIRQVTEINMGGLFDALTKLGFGPINGWGWCYKSTYGGILVDMFFPESVGNDESGSGPVLSAEDQDELRAFKEEAALRKELDVPAF